MDEQYLQTIAEDLEYLRDEWCNGASQAAVRRGSAILRCLLVEGNIGRAWRYVGFEKEPHINAMDINYIIGDTELHDILIATAGGATNNDMTINGMCRIRIGSHTGPETPKNGRPAPVQFGLTEYLESICAISEGNAVNRREIIKYMANIKGGVHLSNGRSKAREEALKKRVSKIEKKINISNMDALFHEMLSIGQAVGNSPDITKLIDTIQLKGSERG